MKKQFLALLVLGCLAALAPAAHAQTLYAATGSNGVAGNLYTINATTAVATLVGPVLIGSSPVGLTALALNPVTGVLYGLTTNDGPSPNRSLVTVNPATGAAVLIGSIGANAAGDMAFNSSGVLFAWPKSGGNLVTINLTTGASTVVGPTGAPFVNGGAVSFVGGVLYAAVGGSNGPLYTVNTSTGAATAGPTLTGAPIDGGMAAMTTSGGGVLYAVDSDMSGATTSRLVTINATTGAVTQVGALLPTDTDALAFAVTLAPAAVVPTLSTLGILALGLVLAAVGLLLVSRR